MNLDLLGDDPPIHWHEQRQREPNERRHHGPEGMLMWAPNLGGGGNTAGDGGSGASSHCRTVASSHASADQWEPETGGQKCGAHGLEHYRGDSHGVDCYFCTHTPACCTHVLHAAFCNLDALSVCELTLCAALILI